MEHGIEKLTTCVYFLMDFYLIEKSYPLPQTREIANFGKIWPIIPPIKKPDLHPCQNHYNILTARGDPGINKLNNWFGLLSSHF